MNARNVGRLGRTLAVVSFVVVGTAGRSTLSADVTCIRDRPVPYVVISTLPAPPPDLSIGCDPVPLPDACFPSAVPTVQHWSEHAPQELKITATPIDPMSTYYSVTIWAQYLDSQTSTWEDLWVHESKDAVDAAKSASRSYVEFNATGLKPGVAHRFRAAWCRMPASVKGCNCYPEAAGFVDELAPFGSPDPQPTVFPTPPVTTPTPIEISDDFQGPATTSKRSRSTNAAQSGDGLGPKAVWMTDDAGASPPASNMNGSHIASSGGVSFAEIPVNAQLLHVTPLTQQHSFAEILGRGLSTSARANPPVGGTCPAVGPTVPSGRNFRLAAQTRTVEDAGIPYAYATQALYEPDWGCDGQNEGEPAYPDPTVRVLRVAGMALAPLAVKDVKTTAAYSAATGEGCEKDGVGESPGEAGVAGLKNGSPVLVRAEVINGTTSPQVTSWLGWNCSSGTCQWRCRWRLTDTAITNSHPLYLRYTNQLQGFRSNH